MPPSGGMGVPAGQQQSAYGNTYQDYNEQGDMATGYAGGYADGGYDAAYDDEYPEQKPYPHPGKLWIFSQTFFCWAIQRYLSHLYSVQASFTICDECDE